MISLSNNIFTEYSSYIKETTNFSIILTVLVACFLKTSHACKLSQYFGFKNSISSPLDNRDGKKILYIVPIMHIQTLYFTQNRQNCKRPLKKTNWAYSENKHINS